MIPIEDRLTNHLSAVAGYVTPATSDPGAAAVIGAARRRQFRRRRIATMSSALILILTAVTIAQVTSGRDPQQVIVGNGPNDDSTPAGEHDQAPAPDSTLATAPVAAVPPDESGNLITTSSALTWTRRGESIPVYGTQLKTADGTLYGVGTVPANNGGYQDAMYRSTDGLDWVRTDQFESRRAAFWNRGALAGDQLYELGTAAMTGPITPESPGGDVVVKITGPDTSYSIVVPGFDLRELAKFGKHSVDVGPAASGPLGILLSANVAFTQPSLTTTHEFAQFSAGDVLLFFSASGTAFEPVALPPATTGRSVNGVVADATGFSVVTSSRSPSGTTLTVFHSPDGRMWTEGPSTMTTSDGWFQASSVDGRIVVHALGQDGATIWTTDGVTWTFAGTIPAGRTAADGTPLFETETVVRYATDDGIAISRRGIVDEIASVGGARISIDGYSFVVSRSWTSPAVIDEATGEQIGEVMSNSARVASDPGNNIVILDAEGNEDLRVTWDEFSAALEAETQRLAPSMSINPTDPMAECHCDVLYSADGLSWNSIDAATLAGEPVAQVMWAGRTANGWAMYVRLVRRNADGSAIVQAYEGL